VAREIRAEEAYAIDAGHFRNLAAPTLLLLGEESPDWAREGTERVSAALPHARLTVLRSQGHAAIMTAPELVADEVTRFLCAGLFFDRDVMYPRCIRVLHE
jgi:pimeloyl-ACP methyl ester carboxylesterase